MKYYVIIERIRYFLNDNVRFRYKTLKDKKIAQILVDNDVCSLKQVWSDGAKIEARYEVPEYVLKEILELTSK